MSNDIKIRITPLALDKLNAPPPAPAQPAEPQSLLDRLFNSPREPPKPFPVPIVQDPVKDVPIWRRFFKSDTSDTESQHSRALTSNTKPILGIRYRPTTMEDGTPCVLITSVVQDSICDRAGVKEQDVVMSWNGYPIENEEQLIKYYQASKYGETVTLTCRPFNHINDATKERQYNIHLSLGSAFSDCSSVVDSTFTSEIVATDTDNSTPNYSIVSESVNSTAVSDQNHGELLHHFTKIPDSPRTPALTSKKSETGSAFSRISTLVSSTKSAPSSPRGQPVVAKQPPIKIGFFGIKSNPPAPSSPVLVPQPTDTQLKPKLGINFIEKPHPKPSLNHEVAVVVVSVFEGSICYEAGLQVDDMFISWNEKPIYTSDDLNEAYSSAKLGDTVVLRMRPYSLAQHCHMDKICIITIAHGVDQGRMRDALAARGEKLVYLNDCISEKRLALKDALSNVKAQAILPSVKMKGDLVHREEAETHKMNAVDIESELLNLEYERYSLEQLQAKEKSLRAHQQIAELEYLRRTNLSLKSRLKNLELFVKHKMEENQILRSLLQHKSTSTSQELNTENDSDFDSDEDSQDQTSTAAPPKS